MARAAERMAMKALRKLVSITVSKIGVFHAEDQAVFGNAGIVDQYVESAVGFDCFFDCSGEARRNQRYRK